MNNAQNIPLFTFYKGWEIYQRSLLTMIKQLSNEDLVLAAPSHQWDVRKLTGHIIGDRVWWFHTWMGDGGEDLAYLAHWDPMDKEYDPNISQEDLVKGIELTWELVKSSLMEHTIADLEQTFSPPSVMSEEEKQNTTTRSWIIWHVLEHEIHHGGEISLILGMNGLKGIYGDR